MVRLRVFNAEDEIKEEETFETIDACIHYMIMEGFYEDFLGIIEEDDDELKRILEGNGMYRFGGGYTNVHIEII